MAGTARLGAQRRMLFVDAGPARRDPALPGARAVAWFARCSAREVPRAHAGGCAVRLAYADPPYIGVAHRYPEKREVDHAALLSDLATYDGWALSASSPSLREILPMCPEGTRAGAW